MTLLTAFMFGKGIGMLIGVCCIPFMVAAPFVSDWLKIRSYRKARLCRRGR